MAITSSICNSYKMELFSGGFHQYTDAYKMALYTNAATLGAATTGYIPTNEVAGAGYTGGGGFITGFSPGVSSTTAWIDFTTDPSWGAATITASGALIYNSTRGGRSVCTLDFGADKISTNGTFTVQFPTPDSSNALLRWSGP